MYNNRDDFFEERALIRKFLIVSKRVYLSTSKIDDEQGVIYNIDLQLPLQEYWKLLELLKKADFLLASKEQMADIQAIYRRVFKLVAPFAVFETDRAWLVKRSANQ